MTTSRESLCAKHGIADRELVDIIDSPAGLTFTTTDGVRYIDVPEGTPDGEGKFGLMYLDPPMTELGYNGDFPVFVNPEEDDETPVEPAKAADGAVDLDAMSKTQLVAYAADTFGAQLSKKDNVAALRAAIADLQAAADAETGGGDQ